MPEIISKNILVSIPKDLVDIFSELIAENAERKNKIFNQEIMEKMEKFNY